MRGGRLQARKRDLTGNQTLPDLHPSLPASRTGRDKSLFKPPSLQNCVMAVQANPQDRPHNCDLVHSISSAKADKPWCRLPFHEVSLDGEVE